MIISIEMGLSLELENLTAGELVSWAIETYASELRLHQLPKRGHGNCRSGLPVRSRKMPRLHFGYWAIAGRDASNDGDSAGALRNFRRGRHSYTRGCGSDGLGARVGALLSEPDLRALCCEVRKVRPLQRKLREFKAWASGLRREQSQTRAAVRKAEEVDAGSASPRWRTGMRTGRPVHSGSRRAVHPLYLRGYTSIGCAPCTRAVEAGEDERAGRWWWEEETRKECGIHFAANGTVERDA